MEKDKLKEVLARLRADLRQDQPIDTELKQMLQALDSDIQSLLGKEDASMPADTGLAGRAQGISAKFAARHPRLEPVLRELGAILERMGI